MRTKLLLLITVCFLSIILYSCNNSTTDTLENNSSLEDVTQSEELILLYNLRGDTIKVNINELQEFTENGWYTEPVCTMYAADGRTRVTLNSEIEAYINVGWYTEPVCTMYAADGRTRVTLNSEVDAYKNVGWYTEPVCTMYATDGRTRVTLNSEVEAYKNVGWYTEPVCTMYAVDGRTRVTLNSEVEAYKNVGWYTEPVCIMYAADGRTRVTLNSEVEAYKKVGWYTEPQVSNKATVNNEFETNDYFLNLASQNAQSAYKKTSPDGVDGTFNFKEVEKVSDSFVIVSGTMTIFNGMEFYGYCYITKENGTWNCTEAGYIFGAED